MKKLLNIDGGGVRVYFPLLILNEIEKRTQKKIIDIFDFYSGVSASSIILAGLLTKYTLPQIIVLFKSVSKNIFYRSYTYSIISVFGIYNSKYTDYYINQEFQKIFGETRLDQVKKPLCILAYDLSHSKPKQYHSYKYNDYLLWKVVRASTAAPTYFPPFNYDDTILIDGGVVVNNLSETTFVDALSYFGQKEEIFQLSLGTGILNHKFTKPPSGVWSWSTSILDVLFSASSSHELHLLKKISHLENLKQFYRIDIELTKNILLDDYTAFDHMDQVFKEWLGNNNDYINKICEELIK